MSMRVVGMGENRTRVKKTTPFTVWFRDALNQAEMSYSEFARQAKLSGPAMVSRWASGEAQPTLLNCTKIAETLRVDLDFVLEKAGYRPLRLVGETSERGAILASMVNRVKWDDETRYHVVYRMVRGFLEEDRLRELNDLDPSIPSTPYRLQ